MHLVVLEKKRAGAGLDVDWDDGYIDGDKALQALMRLENYAKSFE
jgi:hypothetical protein